MTTFRFLMSRYPLISHNMRTTDRWSNSNGCYLTHYYPLKHSRRPSTPNRGTAPQQDSVFCQTADTNESRNVINTPRPGLQSPEILIRLSIRGMWLTLGWNRGLISHRRGSTAIVPVPRTIGHHQKSSVQVRAVVVAWEGPVQHQAGDFNGLSCATWCILEWQHHIQKGGGGHLDHSQHLNDFSSKCF